MFAKGRGHVAGICQAQISAEIGPVLFLGGDPDFGVCPGGSKVLGTSIWTRPGLE